MVSSIEHYTSTFSCVAAKLPGADISWMKEMRQEAMDAFTNVGFPTPRNEDWKYTRINPIEKRPFKLTQLHPQDQIDWQRHNTLELDCHRLVFINGMFNPQASCKDSLPGGITVTSLDKAIYTDPNVVRPHLSRYVDATTSGFSALNTALMGEGAFIHIPKGAQIDKPILVLFVTVAREQEICAHPRILIVADEDSSTRVIEQYSGSNDIVYFNNCVTEAYVGRGAKLEHYKIQNEGAKSFHVSTCEVAQARESQFTSHSISLGGQLVRNDINCVLNDEAAVSELNGLFMATGRQHVDNHTRIDHAKPAGISREYYKGILAGGGRGVFNGRVYVHPDAQKTDAEQYNNNLLLSRNAEIDTKPQLEIFADDVKCAHGATVGQLDDNMVFYLRARGIPESTARGLLTYGFASDVLQKMSVAPIRRAIQEQVLDWLPDSEQVRKIVT